MYLIGIDIGTSSTKGVLVDQDGKVIARGRRPHKVEFPLPGWAEQNADLVWWNETRDIIQELLAKSEIPPGEIAAVGCSGVCPVVLPIDKNGKPLRNGILYSIDARADKQIRLLKNEVGLEPIDDSGQPLSFQSVIPKLMWLRENEPDVWANTDTILGATGYVVYRLCGVKTVDHFTAADGGFGYSMKRFAWNEEAFRLVDIDVGVMPRLAWPSDIAGHLSAQAAAETGLLEGTPVITGTGDALAEMISTGVSQVGETALLYGSTLTTMTIIDGSWFHEGFITVPGSEPEQITTSSVLGSGMSSFSWLRRLLGEETAQCLFDRYEKEARIIARGADGLLALPYLTGQRSPVINPHMRGAFIGLSQHHQPSHMLRSLMEGLGFALRFTLEEIPYIDSFRVVGGGVNSPLLLQIVSDICRRTQKVVSGYVGAPLGSAWLAGRGVGLVDANSHKEWVGIEREIIPDESSSAEYDAIYDKFKASLMGVEPVFKQ